MLPGHKTGFLLSPCSSIETLWQNGFSCWFNCMKRKCNHNTQVCYSEHWKLYFYGPQGNHYDCFPRSSNCKMIYYACVTVYTVGDILRDWSVNEHGDILHIIYHIQ